MFGLSLFSLKRIKVFIDHGFEHMDDIYNGPFL